MKDLNVPVLFLIFNREDTTRRVFEAIRAAKPKRLYVAADGPRATKAGEAERCEATRAIIKEVDWECEVKTLFRDNNLGCKVAVQQAITWFFENEEMGIILEDDCLPDPTFFAYCEENLNYYKNNDRIMLVAGCNFQEGQIRGKASHYFSKIPHIWGWASWRRAWAKYDVAMTDYPKFLEQNIIEDVFPRDNNQQKFWIDNFNKVFNEGLDTWDYQWVYTIFKNEGLCVAPNYNLISNIGFNADATHTHNIEDRAANRPTQPINEVTHPDFVIEDFEADQFSRNYVFFIPINDTDHSLLYRAARKVKRTILN